MLLVYGNGPAREYLERDRHLAALAYVASVVTVAVLASFAVAAE